MKWMEGDSRTPSSPQNMHLLASVASRACKWTTPFLCTNLPATEYKQSGRTEPSDGKLAGMGEPKTRCISSCCLHQPSQPDRSAERVADVACHERTSGTVSRNPPPVSSDLHGKTCVGQPSMPRCPRSAVFGNLPKGLRRHRMRSQEHIGQHPPAPGATEHAPSPRPEMPTPPAAENPRPPSGQAGAIATTMLHLEPDHMTCNTRAMSSSG